jgi:hypothetical protein
VELAVKVSNSCEIVDRSTVQRCAGLLVQNRRNGFTRLFVSKKKKDLPGCGMASCAKKET